jgi:two-component system, NarL family, nitrate/nitrite response regulator NarL
MSRVSVVVGDDHPVVREGVVRVLSASGRVDVVGEAGNGLAVVDLIRACRPQVALVDFRMPGLDGAQVALTVRREGLPTGVLILSAYTETSMVFQAMEYGAAGYLSKDAGRAEIIRAIGEVAAGRQVLPPQLAEGVLGQVRAGREDRGRTLTTRERQVLAGIADGKSIPALAQEMFLSPSTVKTHVQRLYDKLGVSDRPAALAEASRRGFLA